MKSVKKKVRLELDETAWELIEEVSTVMDTTPKVVLNTHLKEVVNAFTKSNVAIKMPAVWVEAWENIQQRRAEEGEHGAGDVAVLHTSRRTNSGYEGVYAHSNPARGFTARGRDPVTKLNVHLGLFPTAVSAAWARYHHYRNHNMPYGLLEEEILKVSSSQDWRDLPEKWIRAMAIWNLSVKKKILPDLPDEDRRWETINPLTEMDC